MNDDLNPTPIMEPVQTEATPEVAPAEVQVPVEEIQQAA